MQNSSMKDRRLISISLLVLVVIWVFLSNIIDNPIYLPKVREIGISMLEIIKEPDFGKNIINSLVRGFESFTIAIILAFVLGLFSSFSKIIYNFLYPINLVLKSIPTIAFIVITLIWLNKDYSPLLIGTIIAFPLFYEIVQNSILNIDKNLLDMCNVYKVKWKEKLIQIYIPNIFFNIFIILPSTLSLILKVVIAAEVYGQPKYGIGSAIQVAKINFDTTSIFAWIIIVAIISFSIDVLLKPLNNMIFKIRWDKVD